MRLWILCGLVLLSYIVFKDDGRSTSVDIDQTPLAQIKKHKTLSMQVFRKPASRAPQGVNALQAQLKILSELKACYASHTCAFADTDPRSYEIELGKKIKFELSALRRQFAPDPKNHRELLKTAQEFMQTGDGFVQEEAMNILSDLPPSGESLVAITSGLQSSPDPALMEQALGEFRRYMGTAWEDQVHSFLSSTIATGAQFSALTVSEKIQPFVNEKSFSTYQKALKGMTPGAKAASNLNAALREYRRLQTGA